MQKRIVAINDLSCYGRCALTVTLPVLCAAGAECAIIPTAVLSTHLAYPEPINISMTEYLPLIGGHLKSLDTEFDAIAIGYLDNAAQGHMALKFIKDFKKKNTIIFADPTMADNGKMYGNPNFDGKFIESIRNIVKMSDITVPNITEAAFLCGLDYKSPPYEKSYIDELLYGLAELGPGKVIVTGVILEDGLIGCAGLDKKSGKIFYAFDKMFGGRFIGTGDLFAAAVLGALLNGFGFEEAGKISTAFISYAIEKSLKINTQKSMSINFEQSLPFYMKRLNII